MSVASCAQIEFHIEAEFRDDPPPIPAAQAMPDWLKHMRPDVQVGDREFPTLKKCAPFIDAMTSGYLIPLRGTVQFVMKSPGQLEIAHVEGAKDGVVTSQPSDYTGTPFERALIVKFINHWTVKTPPGYSTLFVPMLNQYSLPFQILSGMVDTDRYYRGVSFPAVCLMKPGMEVILERGTPIVQAIPIHRESWKSQILPMDDSKRIQIANDAVTNPHHYRDHNWVKKEYH